MKDAYGTVIDEKSAIEEVKESEYPLSYKEESTQKINEETHSISGEEENWRPVEEDGMLKVITEQVIKEKERTPGFLSRFSFRKA